MRNKKNELGKIRCVTLVSGEWINIITVFCVHVTDVQRPNDQIECCSTILCLRDWFLSAISNLHAR